MADNTKLCTALRCSGGFDMDVNMSCGKTSCKYLDVDGACDIVSMCQDAAIAIEELGVELKGMRGAANSYKAENERLKKKLAAYEDSMLTPAEALDLYLTKRMIETVSKAKVGHINELLDAEEQGRLIMLPREVGSKLFRIERGKIYECWVTKIIVGYDGVEGLFVSGESLYPTYRCVAQLGKTLFQTKEAAEAKLKEER